MFIKTVAEVRARIEGLADDERLQFDMTDMEVTVLPPLAEGEGGDDTHHPGEDPVVIE